MKHGIFLVSSIVAALFCSCNSAVNTTPEATPATTDNPTAFLWGQWNCLNWGAIFTINPDGSFSSAFESSTCDGYYCYDSQTRVLTIILQDEEYGKKTGHQPYEAYVYYINNNNSTSTITATDLSEYEDLQLQRIGTAPSAGDNPTTGSDTFPSMALGDWQFVGDSGITILEAGGSASYISIGSTIACRYTYSDKAKVFTMILPDGEYGYQTGHKPYEAAAYYIVDWSANNAQLCELDDYDMCYLIRPAN